MPLVIAVPKESLSGEARVALDPAMVARLTSQHGVRVQIESDCGRGSGFYNADYGDVPILETFGRTVRDAAVIVKVQPPTVEEVRQMPYRSVLLGQIVAYCHHDVIEALMKRRITTLAMDRMPRITRAQPMDVLASQATIAGYKAALIAAEYSPRMFPMLTTAAGTLRPSRVIVIGAGVAGLQAIATARRLGAQVEAYDIRRAAKEQIESLGARMIDTGVEAEGVRGYARALTREEKQTQHDVLAERMSQAHAVICAASIPGRQAPRIVTEDMVEGMLPDSVIVDMAAESGGNCELTRAGETYRHGDKLIVGAVKLPSRGAVHASEMYSRNVYNFLRLMLQDDELHLNWEDEIIARCMLTHDGQVFDGATAEALGVECAPPIQGEHVWSEESPDQAAGWIEEDDSPPKDPSAHLKSAEQSDVTESADQVDDVIDAAEGVVADDVDEASSEETAAVSDKPVDVAVADDDPPIEGDDLTQIDGIGPALQRRLYAFGVTHYTQLAAMDAAAIDQLERQLELDAQNDRSHWAEAAARLERQPK